MMRALLAVALLAPSLAWGAYSVAIDGATCDDNAACDLNPAADQITVQAPGVTVTSFRGATSITLQYSVNTVNGAGRNVDASATGDGYNVTGPLSVAFGGTNLNASATGGGSAATAAAGLGPYTDHAFSAGAMAPFVSASAMSVAISIAAQPNGAATGAVTAAATIYTPPPCTVDCVPPPCTVNCTPPPCTVDCTPPPCTVNCGPPPCTVNCEPPPCTSCNPPPCATCEPPALVPTLSEWSLLSLSGLMVGVVAWRGRKTLLAARK